MEKKEPERKVTFFMSLKFFYDYKITLIITASWFIIYYILSVFWGLFNDLSFLYSFMKNLNTYLVIPMVFYLTHIVKFGIRNFKDFFYGDKSIGTKKLLDSEETFELLREKFYNRLNYNRVIIPIVFIISAITLGITIYGVFVIYKGILYGVSIISSPILIIANIVNFGYLFLLYIATTSGLILITIALYSIYNIRKWDNKSSIHQMIEKYKSILKGESTEPETITLFEFQTYSREIGVFVFQLFFKLLFAMLILNLMSIVPLQLGLYSIEDFIMGIYISIIVGFVLILLFIMAQHSFHKILKKAKNVLIESLNQLQDKLNGRMGDQLFSGGEVTQSFKNDMKKLEYINNRKMEIKKLGSWPYEFLKILKLVGVVALSLTPIIMEFIPI